MTAYRFDASHLAGRMIAKARRVARLLWARHGKVPAGASYINVTLALPFLRQSHHSKAIWVMDGCGTGAVKTSTRITRYSFCATMPCSSSYDFTAIVPPAQDVSGRCSLRRSLPLVFDDLNLACPTLDSFPFRGWTREMAELVC